MARKTKKPSEKVMTAFLNGKRLTSKKMKTFGLKNPEAHVHYLRHYKGLTVENSDGAYSLKI